MNLLYRQGLERDWHLWRFPRPCRFVARRLVFTCEFRIREALAADL